MRVVGRVSLASVIALVAMAFLNACSPSESDDPGDPNPPPATPFPATAGIQQNLSLAALEADGWSVCLNESYTAEGTPVAGTLAGCTGTYMMLACRNGTGDTLALAAADLRTVVTQADAATATAHHVANGVGWYFTEDLSWGFFPAGQALNRAPCDWDSDGLQTMKQQRLCWHTTAGELKRGYRCGDNELNTSASWQRIILVHP